MPRLKSIVFTDRNVYDISKVRTFPPPILPILPTRPLTPSQPCLGDLCYLEVGAIKSYLDLPSTRAFLGVSSSSPASFSPCAPAVGAAFNARLDKYAVPSQHYVAGLLERGVRVLIYVGDYDWICNWVRAMAGPDPITSMSSCLTTLVHFIGRQRENDT